MKKAKSSPKKQGKVSGTQHSSFISQEVLSRKLPGTTLEVQKATGEVVNSFSLPEPSAGHQITPDGELVYALTGGEKCPPAEVDCYKSEGATHRDFWGG
ncbi:hypothetical protein FAZ69_15525 [Trinickia terrae]|uniref:Uncharacterized protein n=1 Tax=Trinickia terrae TaxID=2571161 RepID=A0A4U1I380_9BURK|nr:hypothetical protein [Trinickia terrae]TKC87701.1 hypothetical protein FAZ69_15525 [Trinickia terrae]